MNKHFLIFFIALFLVFSTITSFAQNTVTKERLLQMFRFSDDDKSWDKAAQVALDNPNILMQIIFIPKEERDNFNGRHNALMFLKICSYQNKIPKEQYLDAAFKVLKNIEQYAYPYSMETEKFTIQGEIAHYGLDNPNIAISENFLTLYSILKTAYANDLIKNQGVINSLNKKLENAQKSLQKNNKNSQKTAINQIEAAINELDAQRGNHITEDAHKILTQYCQNLITKIQNTN